MLQASTSYAELFVQLVLLDFTDYIATLNFKYYYIRLKIIGLITRIQASKITISEIKNILT